MILSFAFMLQKLRKGEPWPTILHLRLDGTDAESFGRNGRKHVLRSFKEHKLYLDDPSIQNLVYDAA